MAHKRKACHAPTLEECCGTNILCAWCLREVPVPLQITLEREYVRGQCHDRRLIRRQWLRAAREAVRCAREGRGVRPSAA